MAASTASKISYEAEVGGLRERLHARREELAPVLAEIQDIDRLLEVIEPARGRRANSAGTVTRRRSSNGKPSRADQLVSAVAEAGPEGLTAAQAAEKMGILVGYIYRLGPKLEQEGRLTKRDGRYFTAAVPAAA